MCGGTCTYVCGSACAPVGGAVLRCCLACSSISKSGIQLSPSFSTVPFPGSSPILLPFSPPLPLPLCACVCVHVQEIEPGLHSFSACDLDGHRTTRIFFPLNSEPGTRVSLAILLLEDLGLHTQHSGASLHPCDLLPKVMIKVVLQRLHLELRWVTGWSHPKSDLGSGRLESLLAKPLWGQQPLVVHGIWRRLLILLNWLLFLSTPKAHP